MVTVRKQGMGLAGHPGQRLGHDRLARRRPLPLDLGEQAFIAPAAAFLSPGSERDEIETLDFLLRLELSLARLFI